jgi:excisionase family DNA binding protein
MPKLPSNLPPGDNSDDLQTTEELAAYLKVDPKTVYNWARDGIIPEAMRIGRVVRFSLEDVKASLDLNRVGEGRYVELVVMALSLVCGPAFPRIPKVDLGSVTMDEVEQLKTLCAAYAADLEDFPTPQEQAAYCEGVIQAARLVKME